MYLQYSFSYTVEPEFSGLGCRALSTVIQIWFYEIDLPGFSALSGFRNFNHGDRYWYLNPGSTILWKIELKTCVVDEHS